MSDVIVLDRFCKECGKKLATINASEYCYVCDGNTWQKGTPIPGFLVERQPLETILTQLEMESEKSLF